ncbi:MAG: peptide ABC transporter substrate-binding protein, partial [Spirochaetaceae bacterium]|nr:peptide ABC transporter substrate-binding protein [Spirochaetaceae bacterium]
LNINNKVLCSAKARQALNLAVDRAELVEKVLDGNGEPTASLIAPRNGWKEVQSVEFNPEKAKELLAESGFSKSKNTDEIILAYNDENAAYKATAEFIAEQLKKNLNLTVSVQSADWETFAAKRRANGFDMARGGWRSSLNEPTAFLLQLVSTDKENAGRYNNPSFDSLMRSACRTPDNAERTALLHQAEYTAVAEDAAILPLYFEKSYQLINTEMWQGWYANPADIHSLTGIKLKDIEFTK